MASTRPRESLRASRTVAATQDCNAQQLSLFGVPGFPPAPNDQGCAYEECSVGGQACSRAIQYHEFLPGQTPIHIHEYCECN